MSKGIFSPIITGDQKLDRIQANIANTFNSIQGPYIGGNLIAGINLITSTPLAIPHGLGRQPIVWTLGDIGQSANVFRVTWDINTITLEATANCSIAIWVN